MSWAYILPFILGAMAVLQGGLNRQISRDWGLGGTVFLNSLMLVVGGLILFLVTRLSPDMLPEIFRDKGSFKSFSWWFVLPGLFGLSLVTGIPVSIQKIGALKVIVALVGAQLVTSMIWDATIEGIAVSPMRVIGALMSFGGALLVALRG